jgi:hypothetical protein
MFMSDYLMESALWALYYDGLIFLGPVSFPVSTTAIDLILLGQLSRNGFAEGMPC